MLLEEIIEKLPYEHPFLFVDEITFVDEIRITGTYTFDSELEFYNGHFKGRPVTPGVILTETAAQIGLVSFGVFLLNKSMEELKDVNIAMTSSEMEYYLPVLPSEKVIVKSEKEFFRFNKLKCKVQMFNEKGELVCRGKIAGMIQVRNE